MDKNLLIKKIKKIVDKSVVDVYTAFEFVAAIQSSCDVKKDKDVLPALNGIIHEIMSIIRIMRIENVSENLDLSGLRELYKNLERLENRDTCPICRRGIIYNVSNSKKVVGEKIANMEKALVEDSKKGETIKADRERSREEVNRLAESYLVMHKDVLQTVLKKFKSGDASESIPESCCAEYGPNERSVFNRAMELFLDTKANCGFIDEEALFFRV